MSSVRPAADEPPRVDALYVTYDGLLEPLGQSQVLGYLERLSAVGVRIAVLSFEKPDELGDGERRRAIAERLARAGIRWSPLRYHRRPRLLVTGWDLVSGTLNAVRLARRHRPRFLHARSYLPGLMAFGAKLVTRSPFVFDMRGFWPEERAEMGLFRPQGLLYRSAKLSERVLLASADHIVVLTESAKAILRDREASRRLASGSAREKAITVIPCCVDLERFQPRARDVELAREHGLEGRLVVGNVGAFNQRYLTHEMFRFAFHVKAHVPTLRFVYLTQQDPGAVHRAAANAGLAREDVLALPVSPSEVPRWLSLFRLGVFFLRPGRAAKASSFTKLGELLAAGIPVVTNRGVGDVERLIGSERTGLLLGGLTDRDLAAAARNVLPLLEGDAVPPETARACRERAETHLALADGARRYLSVYRSLGLDDAPSPAAETVPAEAS